MKGRELNVKFDERTQEEIARKTIEEIYKVRQNRQKELEEAENKLAEILDKDVEDIREEDAEHWNW